MTKKNDSINKEVYILDDFSINLFLNDSYIFSKRYVKKKTILIDVKNYNEFCTFLVCNN